MLEIKSSFPSRKISPSVDVNLQNQHCKTAEWLADWLTNLLRRLDSQGTRTLEALKLLKALGHSGTEALRHSRHLRHIIEQTPFRRGVYEKPIQRGGLPKKGRLGQFVHLMGGFARKKWWCFFGGLIPQCTLCTLHSPELYMKELHMVYKQCFVNSS